MYVLRQVPGIYFEKF